jgi:hypothetical protein
MQSALRFQFSRNWRTLVSAFVLLIGSAARSDAHTYTSAPIASVQGSTKVWVNSTSHVYHCPGTRYYGATKRGVYMTEAVALSKGNRPAYGDSCGPLPNESGPALPLGSLPAGRSDTQVWVNTSTGVYHCPGSRYYRNTKRGELMSEADARSSGKRPAYGKTCS